MAQLKYWDGSQWVSATVGAVGPGVAAGGSAGQVLTKINGTDYNTQWSAPSSVGGLVLVKSQTVGTGVSSVTVTGAFSTDYDNYRIILSGGTASATADIALQLGASVTGYYGSLQFQAVTAGTVSAAGINNGSTFSWVGGATSGQAVHASVELFGPFLASYTKLRNATYQNGDAYGTMNGEHRVATSYTDFTFTPSTGTLTGGTITVFGYRKA